MKENPIKIKFDNRVNPHSAFDMLKLEDFFLRKSLNHDPKQLHKVEFFIIMLITEGEGRHTIDFTDYNYKKGSLLTIRKDQIHKFHKGNKLKGHLLIFKDEFLISYLEQLEAQKSLQLFNELLGSPLIQLSLANFETIKSIIGRIENEYFRIVDDYSLGIVRSELHILTTKLYRIKSQKHQMLIGKKYLAEFIELQSLIEDNVTNTTRVSDYAKMMAVSTKTLNTISRSILNKSAKELIDEICTKQIKRLLINTPLSIKEIAYASGFIETTNFYKYFKRKEGMTPEQFRTVG